jgi:hypothetical protein
MNPSSFYVIQNPVARWRDILRRRSVVSEMTRGLGLRRSRPIHLPIFSSTRVS